MTQAKPDYDRITTKVVDGTAVRYGIVFGNAKIVFIKSGAGGGIKGYKGKYLKMAHRIHERMGATVICASNPDVEHGHADRSMISEVASERGFTEYEVYLVGASDGGYAALVLASRIPQTVKVLGINASFISLRGMEEKLQAIPTVKKVLVYGTKDDEYDCVPRLKNLICDNLEIQTVPGADHKFTGMCEDYIALVDLL